MKTAKTMALTLATAAALLLVPQLAAAAPPSASNSTDSGSPPGIATQPISAPQAGPAAPAATSTSLISDVALQQDGVLRGQFLDAQGAPQANTRVSVILDGRIVASTQTDAQGRFAIGGLRGGLYQIEAGQTMRIYRVWTADTAPPAASQGALLVKDETIERGQFLINTWEEYRVPAIVTAAALIFGAVEIEVLHHENVGS